MEVVEEGENLGFWKLVFITKTSKLITTTAHVTSVSILVSVLTRLVLYTKSTVFYVVAAQVSLR